MDSALVPFAIRILMRSVSPLFELVARVSLATGAYRGWWWFDGTPRGEA